MVKPRQPNLMAFAGFLVVLFCTAAIVEARIPPQSPAPATPGDETARGIGLYNQGDVQGAIRELRNAIKDNKQDADAWHYLGLGLTRYGDVKEGRKALETAVKLRPDFAASRAALGYALLLSNKTSQALREAQKALAIDAQNAEAYYVISAVRFREGQYVESLNEIDSAIKHKANFAAAYLLRYQSLLSLYGEKTSSVANNSTTARKLRIEGNNQLLKQAAESLEKYLELNPSPPNAKILREQLESLRVYSRSVNQDGSADNRVYDPKEVTTKARVLSKPEPPYTEEARSAQVSGTVILLVVFAADGSVQNILVVNSLSHGLTENSVRAARQIKFIPATKDGRPVSMYAQLEYTFSIY
jgi:TonB family protein